MSKSIEASIECPFYREEKSFAIICEGLFENTVCIHKFKTTIAKRKHEKQFCTQKQGKNCPHYRRLSIMYERGEKV